MAIGDFLSEVGQGLEKGAQATGRVAGALAPAIGKAVVNEEAGYAPQIAAEGRQHTQAMEDQQINAKAGLLENQLKQLQSNTPLFNNDGSVMSPQQRTSAISDLSGQFTQLYSHPRHAGTLMEKLRQAVSPGGMTAGAGQTAPSTPASAMQGFTAAPPAGYQEAQDEQAQERQALQQRNIAMQGINAWADQMKSSGIPEDQINQAKNEAIERAMGATGNLIPKSPKLAIQGGIPINGTDEHGRSFSLQDIRAGNAGKDLQGQLSAYEKGEKDKQDTAEKKQKERDTEAEKRQERSESAMSERQEKGFANQAAMADYREQEGVYKALDTEARESERQLNAINEGYKQPGNKSAVDNALVFAYTRIQAKGGRMTNTEVNMTKKIGSAGLSVEQLYQKAASGELPNDLRKMLYDVAKEGAKASRDEADSAKPKAPQVGGVARALNPVKNVGGTVQQPKTYKQTATGPAGQIGSNDGGNTWFSVKTGKQVQ